MSTPAAQLKAFIARYSTAVAVQARRALGTMRKLTPGAVELVYDNYNALVIGFCASERASDAIFSLGLYPRYINLYFLQNGPQLSDPENLLRGSGRIVRFIRLEDAATLDRPAVRALIAEALKSADVPLNKSQRRRLIVRSISAMRRARRPSAPDGGPKRRSKGRVSSGIRTSTRGAARSNGRSRA